MASRIAALVRVAFVACVIFLAAPALAQTGTAPGGDRGARTYQQLIDEALAEFEASHFEEALAAFEQAYAVKPSARPLRGQAKALFELRAYSRCVRTIDAALESKLDPLTGSLRSDLEDLRARAERFVGRLRLSVNPARSTLLIDGRPAASFASGNGYVLDIGAHTVEASIEGHHPGRRSFEIRGREETVVDMSLQPLPSFVIQRDERSSRVAPIALASVAIAASGAGLVASALWFDNRTRAADRCESVASAGARCDNASGIAKQRDASMWAVGGTMLAMVASVTALVLVLRQPSSPATSATLGCSMSAGGPMCHASRSW